MDVKALYTNIPQDQGIQCVREALNERINKNVPTEFLLRLLNIILKFNIIQFNEKLFKQIVGAAMGSKPIPSYANIFMARMLDNVISDILKQYEENQELLLKIFKRFLDDLFFIFIGSTKALHTLLEEINMIHPNIQFTMQHTSIDLERNPCSCETMNSIPFLDTSVTFKYCQITTDLYR